MNFVDQTLIFPIGRLCKEFVETYLTRYTDPETGDAAVHWDDEAHTVRRKASLFDLTIDPQRVYDAPLPSYQEFTAEWRHAHCVGHSITCGWPETFINDLQRDPQPEPELFGGITIQ